MNATSPQAASAERGRGDALYRKKTLTKAAQWFCDGHVETWAQSAVREMGTHFEIDTREGTLRGEPGDWIAQGPAGEVYLIGATIFAGTYEPAAIARTAPSGGSVEGWKLVPVEPTEAQWRAGCAAWNAAHEGGLSGRLQPAFRAMLAAAPPAPEADAGRDFVAYLIRQWSWSKETFGSALRTRGIIQHISKELREIEAEPHDLAEWVDVIILAMDGFWRHGGEPIDLLPAMQAKQDKNFARRWPDWRALGEDRAIEHDRSNEDPYSTPTAGPRPDLAELERLSAAATQGAWSVGERRDGCAWLDATGSDERIRVGAQVPWGSFASFIAEMEEGPTEVGEANLSLVCTLVNAYRSGHLTLTPQTAAPVTPDTTAATLKAKLLKAHGWGTADRGRVGSVVFEGDEWRLVMRGLDALAMGLGGVAGAGREEIARIIFARDLDYLSPAEIAEAFEGRSYSDHRQKAFGTADVILKLTPAPASVSGWTEARPPWFPIVQAPQVEHKVIALYDDGSGAVMLWLYDHGTINSDGDECGPWPPKGCDRWAYLPQNLEFHCETRGEDSYTFPTPETHTAPVPEPDAVAKPPFRTGDVVHHAPSGENWIVAYADPVTGYMSYCGWPPGEARIADCTLITAVADCVHHQWLRDVINGGGSRAATARRLYGEPIADPHTAAHGTDGDGGEAHPVPPVTDEARRG